MRQEFYGWVMANYAVGWLRYQGATQAAIPESTLSFMATVQLLRHPRHNLGPFSPGAIKNGIGCYS